MSNDRKPYDASASRPIGAKTNPYSHGLFERSDPKHDFAKIRVGRFAFTVNWQRPAITRRSQVTAVVAVAGSIIIVFALSAVAEWRWHNRGLVTYGAIGMWRQISLMTAPYLFVGLWWLTGRRREKRLLGALQALNSAEPVEPAIHIRGRPSELLRFAELPEAGFEPSVFRTSFSAISLRLEMRIICTLGLLALVMFMLTNGAWREGWWIIVFILLPGTFALAIGIPERPTYYRFVPGRLDCFWYGWFSTRNPEVRTVPLRTAQVNIDLTCRKQFIAITNGDETVMMRRDNVPQPLEFALAVAQAAMCTAPAPPIPMDQLYG